MNSTQRLLACLRGQPCDRVPVSAYELVGWNGDAWENHEPSYRALMDLIRESTDCMCMCGVAVPNLRAADHNVTEEHWDEGDQHVTRTVIHTPTRTLTTVTSFADNVKTVWKREHPVKDLDDLAAYLALAWEPGVGDFTELNNAWRSLADARGLPLVSIGDPICELAEAFEFGNFLVHAVTETKAISAALDCLHERNRERLRRVLGGPVRNAVFRICGAEYATPPYLPPELFRLFVTRYDSAYIRMIQDAGALARLHCHGKIARVVDQIAEMAPDALDPLEPPPDGDIDVGSLKKAIGQRVCLMGGLELRHLETATGAFIEDLVRRTIAAGKPNGRFVIMPTAAPISIPLSLHTEENYRRFIETALQAGIY